MAPYIKSLRSLRALVKITYKDIKVPLSICGSLLINRIHIPRGLIHQCQIAIVSRKRNNLKSEKKVKLLTPH